MVKRVLTIGIICLLATGGFFGIINITSENAQGGSITIQPGLSDGKDASVLEDDPDWNCNGYLYVYAPGSGNSRHSYIQFDLSSIPSGADVVSATLKLYTNGMIVGSSLDIGLWEVTNSWGETSITWNNQPSHSTPYLTYTTVSSGGWKEWSSAGFTTLVQDWHDNPATNYGLLIGAVWASDDGGTKFFNSECSDTSSWARPKLEITYNTGTNTPSNPIPYNGATGQSINVNVSWTGGDPDSNDTVTYNVYFEVGDSTPDILVSNNQTETNYDPGTLEYNTAYYWQIIAEDNHGSNKEGPIWSFTTGSKSNHAPNTPSSSFPKNASTNVNINIDLSWTGGDPDLDDTVTYDVYLEADDSTPDTLVSSDQSSISYHPGTLEYSTTYYWKIIAEDNHGLITSSSVWHFTTQLLDVEITDIKSYYHNFFVQGIKIENKFTAIISNDNYVTEVRFELSNGETEVDADDSDGWSVSFIMSDLNIGAKLTVTALYNSEVLDTADLNLNFVTSPAWMDTLLDLGDAVFTQTTNFQYNNKWKYVLELSIPTDPFDVGVTIPNWIPAFGGEYRLYFFFIFGFDLNSEAELTIHGGGEFETIIMDKESKFTFNLSGNFLIEQNTFVWQYVKFYVSGEVSIPVFTKSVTLSISDELTLVEGVIDFSINPRVSLEFTFEPSNEGFQIIHGIAVTEVSGVVGIEVGVEGELKLVNIVIGSVKGIGGIDICLNPSNNWIESVTLYASLNCYIWPFVEFNAEYSWTWPSGTRADIADDELTWKITAVKGKSVPRVEEYTNESIKIEYDTLTEELCIPPANLTANPVGGGVYLSWESVSDAIGYNIYRSTKSKEGYKPITSKWIKTSYLDTELDKDITTDIDYYYVVKSVYANGAESNPSNEVVIRISSIDTDGDGYPDSIDAFPDEATEWKDTDGDGIGNNADKDDDNDGLPDDWENKYYLDPLNPIDAALDPDGDDYTNLEEYEGETNPLDSSSYPSKETPGFEAIFILGAIGMATIIFRKRRKS